MGRLDTYGKSARFPNIEDSANNRRNERSKFYTNRLHESRQRDASSIDESNERKLVRNETLFLIIEMTMWIDRESDRRPNLVLARYRLKKVTIVSDAHKE